MTSGNDLTFYEVAAQVIPVLMLALVIEQRFFDKPEGRDPTANLFLIAVALLALVGEWISMSALGDPGRDRAYIQKTAVILAVTLLFLPLIIRAARPLFAAIAEQVPWSRVVGYILFVLAVAGALVVALTGANVLDVGAWAALILFLGVVSIGQWRDLRSFGSTARRGRSRTGDGEGD